MLRLMQTRPEDAGQYTCIVRNAAGEDRKMFGLSVLGTCALCSILGEIQLATMHSGHRVKMYSQLEFIPMWSLACGL